MSDLTPERIAELRRERADAKLMAAATRRNASIERMTPEEIMATLRELAFLRISEAGPVSGVWDEMEEDDRFMLWMFTLVGGLDAAMAREAAIYGH